MLGPCPFIYIYILNVLTAFLFTCQTFKDSNIYASRTLPLLYYKFLEKLMSERRLCTDNQYCEIIPFLLRLVCNLIKAYFHTKRELK
jgi:hypothetical protein